MTKMSVGWARAENAADLPHDSGLVFPEKRLTVGWRPMLSSSVLDWEDSALLVTPGAGPDPKAPEPPAPEQPGAPSGGGAPGPTAVAPVAGGEPSRTGPKLPAPDVTVTARRTMSLFRRGGLIVDVRTPADAEVRAVLMGSVTQRRGGRMVGPTRKKLTRTKAVSTKAGKRVRFVLPISGDGRRAIADYDRLKATLQVVATYRGGAKVAAERSVLLVDRPLSEQAAKASKRAKR